jgi:hypothetical protein
MIKGPAIIIDYTWDNEAYYPIMRKTALILGLGAVQEAYFHGQFFIQK